MFYFIVAFILSQLFAHVQELTLQQTAFAYFATACKIVAAFISFCFIADVRTCAINAAIYYITAFTAFYFTGNHCLK